MPKKMKGFIMLGTDYDNQIHADRTNNQSTVRLETAIAEAKKAIEGADALLITSGAGMGVDSGLPDFRGDQGFWHAYPAIAKLGLAFEEMANPRWFNRDPALAWAFYGHRLNLYRRTTPHAGFTKLLEIGAQKSQGYFVFTSNVDGQFQKAGFASGRIVECHGSIHHFQCTRPCENEIWEAADQEISVDEKVFRAREPLPRCRKCGEMARPNILMFWDGEWIESRSQLQRSRLDDWLERLDEHKSKLVVIELGAGVALPTVRQVSERMVKRLSGKLIRINLRDEKAPHGEISMRLGAAEAMAKICGRALA
jgi:NAD-dependent SIR2 family protein deacetylase